MGSFDLDRRNSCSRSFTSVLAMAPAGGATELGSGPGGTLPPPMPPALTLFALLLMAQDHQLLLQPLPLQLLLLLLFPLPLLLQVSLPLGCQSLLLLLLQVGRGSGRRREQVWAASRAGQNRAWPPHAHLQVFLQLCLVLPSQVCMLLLELGEQKLLLQLLLLLQGCQLLLQLPLPHHGVCGVHRLHSPGRQPPPHPRAHGTGHGPRQCRLHLYCGHKRRQLGRCWAG